MKRLFCGWNQIDVGRRPKANRMFAGAEFSTKRTTHCVFCGNKVHRPTPIELIVTVHGPTVFKPNQHRLSPARHVNYSLTFNQMFPAKKGHVREVDALKGLPDERFSDAVSSASNLRTLRHSAISIQFAYQDVFEGTDEDKSNHPQRQTWRRKW